MRRILILAVIANFITIFAIYSQESNFASIRHLLEYVQIEPVLPVLGEPIYRPDLVLEIYHANNFESLWANKEYARKVIDVLLESEDYRLLPQDYNAQVLEVLFEGNIVAVKAHFDVLLTDGLLLYSHHLLNDKLNPADFDFSWNFPERDNYLDSLDVFVDNIDMKG